MWTYAYASEMFVCVSEHKNKYDCMRVRVDVFVCKSVRVVEGVNAWVCVNTCVNEKE